MYFNQNNKFYHGIMFHHFHDHKKHNKTQGSISSNDFYKIINYIGRENILDADIFVDNLKNNRKQKKVRVKFFLRTKMLMSHMKVFMKMIYLF